MSTVEMILHPDRAGTSVKVNSDEWHRRQGILQRYVNLFDLDRNGLVEFQEVQQVMVVLSRRQYDDCAQSLYLEWREEVKEDGGPEACMGGCMDNMDARTFCETFQELTKDFSPDDFDEAMASCDDILHELHRLTQGTERGRLLWKLFRKWDMNHNGLLKMNELEAVVEASKERYELDETELSRVQPGLTFPEFYQFFKNYICDSSDDATFYKMVGQCLQRLDNIWRYIAHNDVKQGYNKRDTRLSSKEGGGTMRDPATTRQELSAPAPTKRANVSPMKMGVQSPRRSGSPRKGEFGDESSAVLGRDNLTPLQKEIAMQVAQFSPRSPTAESPRKEAKRRQQQIQRQMVSPRSASRYLAGSPTSAADNTLNNSQAMVTSDDLAQLAAETSVTVISPGKIRPRVKTDQQAAAERLLGIKPDPWNTQSPRKYTQPPKTALAQQGGLVGGSGSTVINSGYAGSTSGSSVIGGGGGGMVAFSTSSVNPGATYQTPTHRRTGVTQTSENLPADEADLLELHLEKSWTNTRKKNAARNSSQLQSPAFTSGWGWRQDDGQAEAARAAQGLGPRYTYYDGYDRSAEIEALSKRVSPLVNQRERVAAAHSERERADEMQRLRRMEEGVTVRPML
eukprot:TRINITY_DN68086_c1_g6_i1.p1 TRINITY_DN68086_c1_g6~~TRINITY_DN68086_c1_g6_i1.p1  ORF type:complete len:625 (-),score=105.94 TRINITY_DN68086_c1_g6_i1:111-1985(-)